MNILITGGAGFIGSNLLKRIVNNNNYNIILADNLWRGKFENINNIKNINFNIDKQFYDLDLNIYENCLKVTKNIDHVIHLADVVAGINYVFKNEFSLFQLNLNINSNILKSSIVNKVKKITYVGTACSYPLEKQSSLNIIPLKEEDAYPANPESAYGWSKLIGEYEIGLASKYGLINSSILRLHNVYGPPSELSEKLSQVIPALCRKLILNEDYIVWGSGKQRRSFVYIDDVVDALINSMKIEHGHEVVQIGPRESISIEDIAIKLLKLSKKNVKPIFDTTKAEGDFDRVPDISKAERILNWKPKTNIDDGLKKTYNWAKSKLLK
jgi:GDP-D-mannose 3', 5'-epimerase